MKHADRSSWQVGDLPFLWNPLPTPHNPEGLPDTLPFTLFANPDTGTLMQAPLPRVSEALARAYSLGSMITGQMDEIGIGRRYTDDFLDFMGARDEGPSPFEGQRVLDVGCGNGYLLHRLAQQGASVLGLEPGEHGHARYDVPVIRDFFPSSRLDGRFDVIVLFGVVEHVEKPVEFMERIFEFLEPAGTVFIGVPDCAPYLEAGDVSCLIHEHWSYFDAQSLARVLRRASGVGIHVTQSSFGGLLYASVRRDSAAEMAQDGDAARVVYRLDRYRERAEQSIARIADFMNSATIAGDSVGVYVPGRMVNALFAGRIAPGNWRFFDDNPILKGTYFPGLSIPVEDRLDLIARPPDRILIMSRSFGRLIATEVREQLSSRVMITEWDELFAIDA